jgi:transcriptional antiterminator RfaH
MNVVVDKRWYLVHTHPCSENRAAMHLRRQGFEICFPRYLKSRRHARRVETVAAPLFPRYIFVAVDLTDQRWQSIQSTVGVTRLVCRGDNPAEVPHFVINDLNCRLDDRGFVHFEQNTSYKLGEKIRVLDGAFSTCFGLFERITDSERVIILLDLLGRRVRVELNANKIAAA